MSDPIESAITNEHSRQEHALAAALDQIDRAFGKDSTGEPLPPPSPMTERVARTLCRQSVRSLRGDKLTAYVEKMWQNHIDDAQEIFSAMGSPTEEMLDDAEGWQPKDSYQDLETAREQIQFLWQVMLDCAEAELSEETLARKARDEAFAKLSPEDQRASWAEWDAALEKTDVGTMKVWQPGEEPF